MLLVDLPKYMNDVLHVTAKENGFYTSLPWSMYVIVSLLTSYWSDWLISSRRLSITHTRKLFVVVCKHPAMIYLIVISFIEVCFCLASVIDACFVIAAAYGGCDPMVVSIFFAISVGATGLQTSGFIANAIDLSPNYSGTISGLSSSFGAFSGVLGPALVGFLTPNVSNNFSSKWQHNKFCHFFHVLINHNSLCSPNGV